VSEPSETVQLAAVRNNPMNIRYIENPTEKVQLSVLHADRNAAALIHFPSDEVRKQAEEIYGLRLDKPADRETEAAPDASEPPETQRAPRKKTERSTQTTQKPSTKQIKAAIEKLDKDLREIQEIPQVKNRDKKLIKALEEFNSSAIPEKKGCDVESILKDLRGKGVKVEAMKAEEWHSLMKGKAIQPHSRQAKESY
jgi:flagellar biosynthesis GTPase FlhF